MRHIAEGLVRKCPLRARLVGLRHLALRPLGSRPQGHDGGRREHQEVPEARRNGLF